VSGIGFQVQSEALKKQQSLSEDRDEATPHPGFFFSEPETRHPTPETFPKKR
jgi:hypothetical protein